MDNTKTNNFKHSEEDISKITDRMILMINQISKDLVTLRISSITCFESIDQDGAHKEYRLKFDF